MKHDTIFVVAIGILLAVDRCTLGANQLFFFGPQLEQPQVPFRGGVWRATTEEELRLAYVAPWTAFFGPAGIAYNAGDSRIYWSLHYSGIARSDLTSEVSPLLFDPNGTEDAINDPHALAFDIEAGYLYWSEGVGGRILRANYTNPDEWEVVVRNIPVWTTGLALVTTAQQLYWVEQATCSPGCFGVLLLGRFSGQPAKECKI